MGEADLQRPQRRMCGEPTRSGEVCLSTILGPDERCSVHGGRVDAAAIGARGGLVSGEKRREQAKTVRDLLRDKVEAEMDAIWSGYEEALDATTTYVTKDGELRTVPDYRTRLAAREALLTQAYGRPAVSIETTGEPTTIVFRTMALAQVVEREVG